METGAVDCGIVYKTDAMSSDKITILSEAPENTHTPIQYDAGIVSDSKNLEATKNFMAFLKTDEAQALFGLLAARFVLRCKRFEWFFDGLFTLPLILPPTVLVFLLLILFGKKRPFKYDP